MLQYTKKTKNGFTWTRDLKSGKHGLCVHRLYFEGFHSICVATITRQSKVQHYTLKCAGDPKSARYNELARAKKVAENYALSNWKKLGFKLTRD